MAFRMAQPWKDPKTGTLHLRQRVPLDLVGRIKGQSVTLPVGDTLVTVKAGTVVQVSLRTKDVAKAKELHATADSALRRYWDAQRSGPRSLTRKEAAALAGTLYRDFASLEDDPGSPELWESAGRGNLLARAGAGTLAIGREAQIKAAREDRFGAGADLLLAREGLVVDAKSRALLVQAVQSAMEAAATKLKANASFDYSPDPAASRFPEWQRPADAKPPEAPRDKLTTDALFKAWAAFHEGKRAAATIKRYRATFKFLAAYMGERDVNTLTGDDIHDWAEHRRTVEEINPRSINKNDLVAVSSVMGWAMSREGGKRMTDNPAAGIGLTEDAPTRTRERSFREAEIKAILLAARAVPADPKNPTAAAAKRWCPWLAAYSGARISELTGLAGSDIREEGGIYVMHFRKTKIGEPRTVPLHEHLIAEGFLAFVKQSGNGPLFFDPSRHDGDSEADPAELRSRTVAKWVRDAVKLDKALQPDHGWRHTWKTIALGADIQDRLSDAITGHSVRAVSRGYEHPTVKMMAAAMTKFPRYPVDK